MLTSNRKWRKMSIKTKKSPMSDGNVVAQELYESSVDCAKGGCDKEGELASI